MIQEVPVWSTRRAGDPASVGHRMEADGFGRPSSPVCGLSSEGLYFRRDHSWADVPAAQRCEACDGARPGADRLRSTAVAMSFVGDSERPSDPERRGPRRVYGPPAWNSRRRTHGWTRTWSSSGDGSAGGCDRSPRSCSSGGECRRHPRSTMRPSAPLSRRSYVPRSTVNLSRRPQSMSPFVDEDAHACWCHPTSWRRRSLPTLRGGGGARGGVRAVSLAGEHGKVRWPCALPHSFAASSCPAVWAD